MPQPLSYHLKVLEHFRHQPKTWDFFASVKTKKEQLNQFKVELLKNTYKFDPATDIHIYKKVEEATSKLGLGILNVSVYQAQFSDEMNASIIFLENEAHLVFSGKITQLLDEEEMLGVIAHELAHIKLYTIMDGQLEVADRIITAIANNYSSEPSYFETARIFRLYTEIFCDRGAYTVLGKTAPLITGLVKVATSLPQVSAESYLKQAEEIFTAEKDLQTVSVSHPENFIRARAIQLWHDHKEQAENEIIRMIEGKQDLNQLDIFKQKELTEVTRKVIELFLKPKWFRTVLVLSQAREFFNDFSPAEDAVISEPLRDFIREAHLNIKEYFCYLLLDFAWADPALESVPFGWAFQFAEELQLRESFDAVVKKEMSLSDKKLQQQKEKSLAAYHEIKEGAEEQIYED